MPRSLLFIAACVVLWMAGCAGSQLRAPKPDVLPADFPNHSASEIRERITWGTDSLYALKANASLTLDSPQRSGSFSAKLNHRRDDSLYLSISPGLGIEAVRALLTPDSFFVYNRIEQQLTYGALDQARASLPVAFTTSDIFSNLTGTLAPSADADWQVEADSARYYLRNGRRTYVVDPTVWRVVRYVEESPSGAVLDERTFSKFDRFGHLYLPRQITLRRPPENTTVALYYRDLTLNPARLNFDLRTSSSVKRRKVGPQQP